ncbi:MAG: heme ABC transporter permease [Rhodospirillales bacterium]|nr:heme ABC transporter permease [Rhodospirillales bacterium]
MDAAGKMFLKHANPQRFLGLSAVVLPWAAGATVVLVTAGVYLALFASPPDYQQGETVRIMYVHVPAAWMAMFCYSIMAAASAAMLTWKHPLAAMVAKCTAPIGASFTFLALLTGSLWGKPMWDAWWVWDARLTSVLVLLFLYLGYIALHNAFDDPGRGSRAASVLALVGFVNVPIIKFSVDWWNTLHQPSSMVTAEGPAIHASMLAPLLVMAGAYTAYYVWVLLLRVRGEIIAVKIRALQMRQAGG